MVLLCRRCRRVLEPTESIVVVEVGKPHTWQAPGSAAARLAATPGRWHLRCAPETLHRIVVAAVAGLGAALIQGLVADAEVYADVMTLVELAADCLL